MIKNLFRILLVVVPYILMVHFGPQNDTGIAIAFWQLIGTAAGMVGNRAAAGFDNPNISSNSEDQYKLLTYPFNSGAIQALLPASLKFGPIPKGMPGWKARSSPYEPGNIEPFINSGVRQLGLLSAFPGVLNPQVAPALKAGTAMQSTQAAQNDTAQAQRVMNRLASTGGSQGANPLATAAMNLSADASQRGVRGAALSQTDQLKRSDTQQTYNLLDAVLKFISSGRGQSVAGLQGAAQLAQSQKAIQQQYQASQLAMLGSGLSSFGGGSNA